MEQTITFSDIAKLDVKLGEILVLRFPDGYTDTQVAMARDWFGMCMPSVNVLFLNHDVELIVVSGPLTQ